MHLLKRVVLRLAKHTGLFRLSRTLSRRRLRILCYHGFAYADEAEFRPKLFISPGQFLDRLEYLRTRGFSVLALDDAVKRLGEDSLPDNPVVITIDDGFRSFHDLALPLLTRYRLPATAYVATYFVGKERPVFALAVQYLFWKSAVSELQPDDVPFIADRIDDWSEPGLMARIEEACIDFGDELPAQEDRDALCRLLGERLDVSYTELVESGRLSLMTPSELRDLEGTGTDVQLHTHRHRFPLRDRDAVVREIRDNRAALSGWLPDRGQGRHFCYPSGEWAPHQWPWLQALGIRTATTCDPGLNGPETPRLALRRFVDGAAIDALEFEAAMNGFTDILRGVRRRLRGSDARSRRTSGTVQA